MIVSFVIHLLQLYAADGNASSDSGATICTSREFKVCRYMSVMYKNGSGEEVLRINESLLKRYSNLPSYKMAQTTFHAYKKLGKECRRYLEAFVAGGNVLEKEINRIAKEKKKQKIAELEEEMKWPEKSRQRYEEIRKRDEEIRLAAQARQEEMFKMIKKIEETRKEEEGRLKLVQEEILKLEEKRKRENELLFEVEKAKINDDTTAKVEEARTNAANLIETEKAKAANLIETEKAKAANLIETEKTKINTDSAAKVEEARTEAARLFKVEEAKINADTAAKIEEARTNAENLINVEIAKITAGTEITVDNVKNVAGLIDKELLIKPDDLASCMQEDEPNKLQEAQDEV